MEVQMNILLGNAAIDKLMQESRIFLTNARLPELTPNLALFGLGEEQLAEGDQLLSSLDGHVRTHAKEYGEQYEATESYQTLFTTAQKSCAKSVKIARIVFDEDAASQVALDLTGRRKRGFPGWYTQAKKFYLGMNSDRISAMSRFGITSEIISAEFDQVEAVAEADAKQAKECGEAQEATKHRDNAFDALGDWMHIYKQIAHIALEDQPQAIEKLGLLDRS